MKRNIILVATHGAALVLGFGLGVYFLPILTAEKAPEAAVLQQAAAEASYSAELSRDLPGSDGLHWGEGTISVSADTISHIGALAPGPDYKVYLTREFVDDEAGFEAVRAEAVRIGDVKSYDGFALDVPAGVNIEDFTTVVVWCESFDEFITAGQYRVAG
ncbi:DM13 domain-containing protein [Qipengyuania qiaonensis]|uniref:DM13 domain-containing protein n=1 Tax=Qipengyuania qiaonensis TaxID=2867240 RepID=A0ABS7J566_9SPHN|nr:DM13 domain-containing protein [Qipengyuania qiaonensis]MBX7482482.1 DM13 domain-containing protein [Qipengyuania qiaonensis]